MQTSEQRITDAWSPKLYQKFAKERNLPFYDLITLISNYEKMNVLDLGCGTGKLTKELHEMFEATKTLGIDSSAAMLSESVAFKTPSLAFQQGDISALKSTEKYDLIFSNSALQWVPNHAELLTHLKSLLSARGQIAIQMPDNSDFPTHVLAREVANEAPFKEFFPATKPTFVLKLEEYSELLYQLGFKSQHVSAQIYPHLLESTESVVEWVQGSLLTYYQSRLSEELYHEFLKRYAKKVHLFFGERKPFFLALKRMHIWAELMPTS